MIGKEPLIGTEQERTEAVDWVELTMQYLTTIPGDRSRENASLIYTSLIELLAGVEPHSVTGKRGQAKHQIAPAVKQRLLRIKYLKAKLRRAPRTGRRKKWEVISLDEHLEYLGLTTGGEWDDPFERPQEHLERVERAWVRLAQEADLKPQERDVLYHFLGKQLKAPEVADLLGIKRGQVHRICHRAQRKLEAWIVSRAWTLNTFMG